MTKQHTPTPLYIDRIHTDETGATEVVIQSNEKYRADVCKVYDGETWGGATAEANADFIVQAVNCHDELVEALTAAIIDSDAPISDYQWKIKARAALAKAKGDA